MIITKRTKIILSLVGVVVLIAAGVFVWGVKTGKLKFKAEVVPTATITGTISNLPTSIPGGFLGSVGAGSSSDSISSTKTTFTLNVPLDQTQDFVVWLRLSALGYQALPGGGQYFGVAGPVHLEPSQTAQVNLTYRTDFNALVYGKDSQTGKLTSLPGASVTLGLCSSGCGTSTQVISQTFNPVTSDAQGYITSTQVNSVLANESISGRAPQIVLLAVSKEGITIDMSKTSFWRSGYRDPAREVKVSYTTVNKTLSGTIKGQDSDSQTQVPLELAKVETEINGKKYFTRTNNLGQYTLDLSDQPTLPSQITVTVSQEDDSYEPKTEQITLSTTGTTWNPVLNRADQKQWVGGLTDADRLISFNPIFHNANRKILTQAHQALAASTWTFKGKVFDFQFNPSATPQISKIPIPGAQIQVKIARKVGIYIELADDRYETTANNFGEYSVTIQRQSNDRYFFIKAWKSGYVKDDVNITPNQLNKYTCQSPLPNTSCVDVELEPVLSATREGEILFEFYGQDVVDYINRPEVQERLSLMTTEIVNLKKDYRIDIPKEIKISSLARASGSAWLYHSRSGDEPWEEKTEIVIDVSFLQQPILAKVVGVHEATHVIAPRRLGFYGRNPVNTYLAHFNICPTVYNFKEKWEKRRSIEDLIQFLDTNCSFTPLTEFTHLKEIAQIPAGHPWDNPDELFASAETVSRLFLLGFSSWMERTDYSQDKKNANKFLMSWIESKKLWIQESPISETTFGPRLILSKTYTPEQIQAGQYP